MKKGGGGKKEDRRRRGWITWRGLRADVNSSFHPNRHYFYKQTIPKVSADPLSPRVNGGGLPWTRALTSPRPVCTLRPHDPAERKISASFLSANRFNRIKRGPTPFETLETEFQELATWRNMSRYIGFEFFTRIICDNRDIRDSASLKSFVHFHSIFNKTLPSNAYEMFTNLIHSNINYNYNSSLY